MFLNFFDLGIAKDMEAVKGNSLDVQGAKAAVKGKATAVEEEFVGISSWRVGLKVAIKVMLCRKWDVTNIYGKYRSTDFVVSDEQGTAIQCSARSNISHCFVSKLEEGKIYSLSNFTVVANKAKYRVRNGDAYTIELEGYTVLKSLDNDSAGFVRFPFQLVKLEEIQANDSAYLIDVIGCPIDFGAVRTTKSGSELLEFQLIDERGTRVRVTLWGSLCNEFLKRPGHADRTYVVIFPSMNIKEYKGEIYLSSTSATTLFDDIDIPQIAALYQVFRENNTPATHYLPPTPATRSVTLSQLILMGKQQKETRRQSVAVHCTVRVDSICTKDTWFYYSCGYNGCKKALARIGPKFTCEICKRDCDFPKTSYRLQVVVVDATAAVVVTLFDDVAETLVKMKATALLETYEDDEDSGAVPREILALTGSCHAFEIKTHTFFARADYMGFTVNKLIEANVDSESVPVGAKRQREETRSEDEPLEAKTVCHEQVTTDVVAVSE